MKKPVIIFDIDQTLFETKLFKEAFANEKTLNESKYIELLYLLEKKLFKELVVKNNILITIFSSKKEFLTSVHPLDKDTTVKRLKDYLEDYKEYQIYFVSDQPTLLKEVKSFNKDILTIWLQTKVVNKNSIKDTMVADEIINKLQGIIPIISTHIPLKDMHTF